MDEIREYHQENRVHFVVKVPRLKAIMKNQGGIPKFFKLTGSISSSNYVLFDEEGRLGRYMSEGDIIKHWFDLRADLYHKRKEFMLARLKKECKTLENKVRFIKAVIEETIVIKKVSKKEIAAQLKRQGFLTKSDLN